MLAAVGCRGNAGPSLKRATEAWDAKDYGRAAQEYEQYIGRNQTGADSLSARFQLANIYNFNLRRYDQAVAHYREFLRQDPSHENAHAARERLAEVLAELGRTYEAIAEYESLNPQDPSTRRRVRLRIADLYFGHNNYSQALTEYEKVIEGAGHDELTEQALMREAAVYNARNQYQLSLGAYERVIARSENPESRRRAVYGVADCYAGLFRFDDAIKALGEIKDETEQQIVARRIAELEQLKREAALAPAGIKP
jgi:tetratricopeptide (TPR) repeat protein